MNLQNFINMVQLMRKAQKDFFLTRLSGDLKRARQYERQVDQMLNEYLKPNKPLIFQYTMDDDQEKTPK